MIFIFLLIITFSISQVNTLDAMKWISEYFEDDLNYLKTLIFKRSTDDTIHKKIAGNDCKPTVNLYGCNAKESRNKKWHWDRLQDYHILAITTNGCTNTSLNYNWKLTNQGGEFVQNFPEFKNKDHFVLRYFTLESGSYYLHVQVTENYNEYKATAKCLIIITNEDMGVKTVGDKMRLVKSSSGISVQPNVWKNQNIKHEYEDTLESNRKTNIVVQPKFSIDGTRATFNPKVKDLVYRQINNETEETTTENSTTTITTTTKESTTTITTTTTKKSTTTITTTTVFKPTITIECMKNCDSIVNRHYYIYVHSWCSPSCRLTYNIEWFVYVNAYLEANPVSGRDFTTHYDRMFLRGTALSEGYNYSIKVNYFEQNTNRKGTAFHNVIVKYSPSLGNCKVDRYWAISLTNPFVYHCTGFSHPKTITIRVFYRADDSRDYLIDWGAVRKKFSLLLPGKRKTYYNPWNSRNTRISAKGIDPDGLWTYDSNIIVESESSTLTLDEIVAIVHGNHTNDRFETVEKLIESGNVQRAVQMVHVISHEMLRIHDKSKHLDMQFTMFTALNKTQLKSSDVILAVAGALKMMYQEYNRTFACEVMNFIKRLANQQLEFIIACPAPLRQESRTEMIAQTISDISSKHANTMRGELQKENMVFNIFQYFPKMDIRVITEDYPNYDDAELDYVDLVKLFIPIVDDMEETNQRVSLSFSMTLATEEYYKQYTCTGGNSFKYGANFGYNYKWSVFGFPPDNWVVGSKALEPVTKDRFLAVLVVYAKTPYWWLDQHIFQSENMMSSLFYSDKTKYENFNDYVELFFTTKSKGMEFYKESVTMPDHSLWTEEIIDQKMTVHRVNVRKSSGLLIIFNNLGNNKLRVKLKCNSRPFYDDVKDYQIVSKNNNLITTAFPVDQLQYGDAWFYIAVLPEYSNKLRAFRATIRYEVGFLSPVCYYLNKETYKWTEDSCRVGPKINMKQMHCLCTNQGHHGYQYHPVYYKLDPYFIVPVKLAISVNFMLVFLMFSVFACYCIALCFAIGTTRRTVYFVSDNLISELYGYLIIIKTGDMANAGTTSNIGIKIFGKSGHCRSHILNYPDPDKKLLQGGSQDWFVVTTKVHLGDLSHIYVWHDSVGLEPSWYCEWIRIKDLQLRQEWLFHINKWFCVIKGESNYISLPPSDEIRDTGGGTVYWIKRYFVYYRYYHTWNILKTYQGYDLTYIERLTLVLSAIYTTLLFTLVFYGFPELYIYDGFTDGNFEFKAKIIKIAVVASVISFMFHLLFTILYRTKNYNIFRVISFDLVWLSWALITVHVVICMVLLIYYGIWVPHITGIALIISTIIALLISIFILEGIYIFFKLKRAKIPKVAIDPTLVIKEIENQRSGLYPRFGNNLLIPYMAQKYRPQTREEWLQKRQKEIKREEISRQLYDLIIFFLFIFLLYFMVFANRRELDVYSNMKMKEMVSGYFTKAERFDEIANLSDFQEYINGTLALATQPGKWYSAFNLDDPGIMIDYCSKIIGVIKLRQLRVCEDCCSLVDSVKNMNWICNPEYQPKYSIIGEYEELWDNKTNETSNEINPSNNITTRINDTDESPQEPDLQVNDKKRKVKVPRLESIWSYEHEPIGTTGYITDYPGGGYSAPLGRHLYNTYYNIKYLVDSKWLDNRSRVYFVEFLTYNANYNIFNDVKLLLEQSSTGLWVKTYQIYTFRLLFVSYELQSMVSLIAIALVVIVAFMIYKSITVMSEDGFWKDSWNYVDLLIIILSITCIVLYKKRSRAIETYRNNLAVAQHNEIVFYDNLRYIEEVVIVLTGLLIGLATIRMWKVLRFGKRFRTMEETVAQAGKPLTAVVVSHLIIIFMYAAIGCLNFGSYVRHFRNFTKSVSTMLLLTINLYNTIYVDIVENCHTSFGYYFYISYISCSFVLIILYIAVIALSYHKVVNKYSNDKVYYTTKQYIKDKSRYEMEKLRRKLRKVRLGGGGAEEILEKKVRPKNVEHRYSNLAMITSYKLYSMRFIAKSVIINKYKPPAKKLSNSRRSLIDKVVFLILSRNRAMLKKEMVYIGIDANGHVQVVREERIVEMEFIADYIVNCGTRTNLIKVFFDQIIITREGNSQKKDQKEEEEEDEMVSIETVEEFADRLIFILEQLKSILRIMSHIRVIEYE